MFISDLSVRRPVFALVINLLIIAFGIVSFSKIPLREYPDTDPPIVSISTTYRGAAANVVETRITEVIEDRLAGIEGVKTISSSSQDGRSRITVEFNIERNIDDAANDIRDRVSGILDNLPDEADPPEVQKADSDDDVIVWLNLAGDGMSIIELTDYARRNVEDRFSSLDGVARVQIGGGRDMAMRVWIDRDALAARNLTVTDIENALRSENVELPAGTIESVNRDFTVRVSRGYTTADDFRKLVIGRSTDNASLIRLADVARVQVAAAEERGTLRGNGVPMVGIGIIKQSKANTLDVARLAKEEMLRVNETLPHGMEMKLSYDTSVFIDRAIHEVYIAIGITLAMVIGILYLFLGSMRATLVPAAAVPVSLVGTFIIIYAFGFSINLLTLLALVLAIGLVVDDAIVVIENVYRRIEAGEHPLVAAFRGTRQVGFAVTATTVVLIAVFLPITFLEGDVGRLFTEFSVTMAVSVLISLLTALTLSPMMASKILRPHEEKTGISAKIDRTFGSVQNGYVRALRRTQKHPIISALMLPVILGGCYALFMMTPKEFAPSEDRGAFFTRVRGPEGASYAYITQYIDMIEERLMPWIETGEIDRLLVRAPGSFGATASFNDASATIVLAPWGEREPIQYYLDEIRKKTADIAGVQVFSTMRSGLGGGNQKPLQIVLGGPTYEDLTQWRDILLEKARQNPGLIEVDHDFFETKPQLSIAIKKDTAADLGVSVTGISRTLETMLGSRIVTTFIERGREYDVILESEKAQKRSPLDIANIYVRSDTTGARIPLAELVDIREFADATALNRFNRIRAITIQAGLADGYSLDEAVTYFEELIRTELPAGATIDYKGETQKLREAGAGTLLVFALSLAVVFLVLAGQFESFVHPFIIMFSVPMAVAGGLIALLITGQSLNIYSQIGMILLVGLAAKNGILIVEFINQLRDEGVAFKDAIVEASAKRFRPILMTSLATIIGALPLALGTGAGAEARIAIGVVIIGGVSVSTFLTLFIIPALYGALARNTQPPETVARELEGLLKDHEHRT